MLRRYGDFELAEDCTQDALVRALEVWPRQGIPDRPGAWLTRVAQRRALDQLRRRSQLPPKLAQAASITLDAGDDRLRLMLVCCHPALSREAQVALTLRTVAGFTTQQVASAFLTSEATVAQRVVRAKRKIVKAGIPYRMPPAPELGERIAEVLAVLYLMFNEGYLSHGWEAASDRPLAEDASWLAGQVVAVLPRHGEALGLLALFRLHLARARARFGADGSLVLLADQDRTQFDRPEILAAVSLLERAGALGAPGPYQLQAGIAACHAQAPSWAATDWATVLDLYDRLLELQPTPVVALNRVVAVWHVRGPAAALAEAEPLRRPLDSYHLLHSTRAELLRRLGRETEAGRDFQRALELTLNPAERAHLRRRLEASPAVSPGPA